jgi:hypothetical protein
MLTKQAAPSNETRGTLRILSPLSTPGTVYLRWVGPMLAPMAQQIDDAIDAYRNDRNRFVLSLNSGGGSVREGEKVIASLRRLRATHRVDTLVERGATCGSMCVPLFLQGESRIAARASTWLFHEVTRPAKSPGQIKRVDGRYAVLIERYWIPAGVSRTWIDRMLPLADGHDYWQTGDQLLQDRSGIITRTLENRRRRTLVVEDGEDDNRDPIRRARPEVPPQASEPPPLPPIGLPTSPPRP